MVFKAKTSSDSSVRLSVFLIKPSLTRLSSVWDRHSIVIGLTGTGGLLTSRAGTGKGEPCFTVCHARRSGWSGWVGAVTSNNRQEPLTHIFLSIGSNIAHFFGFVNIKFAWWAISIEIEVGCRCQDIIIFQEPLIFVLQVHYK